MKKIKSLQKDIKFSYCPNPVTIDKSDEWGEGNIQNFPNGVFLKHDEESDVITHGVQPNVGDNSYPEGWEKQADGLFKKKDIWFIRELEVGSTINIDTLDGEINYQVTVPSSLVCQDKDGQPNEKDSSVIRNDQLNKSYDLK